MTKLKLLATIKRTLEAAIKEAPSYSDFGGLYIALEGSAQSVPMHRLLENALNATNKLERRLTP